MQNTAWTDELNVVGFNKPSSLKTHISAISRFEKVQTIALIFPATISYEQVDVCNSCNIMSSLS